MAPTTNKIKQILFDCDNTLVLSEALAFEACAELSNEMLEKHGRSERYTGEQLLHDFVGQNFRGMMESLCKKYKLDMSSAEMDAYVDRELAKVIETLERKAQPCPGSDNALRKLRSEHPEYRLAVVSSSALSRVQASLRKVGHDRYFEPDHVYSAATSLDRPTSKPDPAVYLHACRELHVEPGRCVAIEDSKSGATAAMRAGIPLIGYVGPYYDEGKDKVEAMAKLFTDECKAIVIMHHWDDFFDCLKKVEAAAKL